MATATRIHIEADEATKIAAQWAIDVQCTDNIRAILRNLVLFIDTTPNRGPDLRNQHPVMIAVLDKLAGLARIQAPDTTGVGDRIARAHIACVELAAGRAVQCDI